MFEKILDGLSIGGNETLNLGEKFTAIIIINRNNPTSSGWKTY